MLTIHDHEHFAKVVEFALNNGCLEQLTERLDYLTQYGGGQNQCQLYYDWAPQSFAVVMNDAQGQRMWIGGLIYSGPEQPLDGTGPAYTVGLGIDASRHGWSLHT